MPERTAVIFSKFSHLPLDIRGGSTAPGAVIQQFNYHGGPNQRWIVRNAGQGPIGTGPAAQRFFLSALGQAMTINSSDSSNVSVSQQPLAPTASFAAAAGQLWALEELQRSDPLDPRRYVIRNARDGRVLGLGSESNAAGVVVEVGTYQNRESQHWEILYQLNLQTLDSTDIIVIFSKDSHLCLDIPGFTLNDTAIQQFPYNGGRNQFWSLAPAPPRSKPDGQ